ncbi:MAG: CCA tRNA nucleotidyltransferase [Oceanicaulis sp.]
MSDRLDPARHAWLAAPDTRRVMDALSPGDSDRARFVGGCVRNAIMGRAVDDVDIATQLEPEAAREALEAAAIKVVPTGLAHGTITAVAEGKPFEVTSLRKDVETFGRRAVVAFTTDWAEDARRRDFRLNSIYARRDGSLYDPFGGIDDARAGRVVFIGEARERIGEDYLRILRFYRFNAWYGAGIDAEGQAACAELAATLRDLSAERVWKELKKLLAAPDPRAAVQAMHEGHVLKEVLPFRLDFNLFAGIINGDRGTSREPDALLRLVALLGREGNAVESVMSAMKASNAERARAGAMIARAGDPRLRPGMDPGARGRALYALGAEAVIARLRLDEAEGLGAVEDDLAAARAWSRPRFPLTGKDLVKAGVQPGPELGDILARLEAEWIDSAFSLRRAALLKRAGELAGGSA